LKLHRRLTGLLAGLCCLIAAPAAYAAGPTVSVRVEGESHTLLQRTSVTLSGASVPGNSGCDGTSAGAAIEAATRGNWDRAPGGFSNTIMGETHDFSRSDYWAEWLDSGAGYKRGNGICTDHLEDGDEVLMLVDVSPYGDGSTTEMPLSLHGLPAQVQRGTDVTVTVTGAKTTTQYGDPGDGKDVPIAGATVAGGGATAVTGADGRATLRLDQLGTVTLKATKPGDVPSAGEVVTVTESAPAAPPVTPAGPDETAPLGKILGIRNGKHYSRKRAPRNLHGTVSADPSGLAAVKLSLTRQARGRCQLYSPTKERFRNSRCGRRVNFKIGDTADWSYLLPKRPGKGRYVLDAIAVDKAGNRDKLARGRNRVVFFVR
jgi:hypothetical protein